MTNKYVSKIVAGGNTLYVKDAEAREALTSKVDVDSALNNVAYDSTNKKLTKTVGSTTSDIVSVATIKSDLQLSKSDVGLGNVTNDAQVKRSEMGSASGVAQLDENGKVPSSQLPSYVDDVIEGYYNDSKFYTTYTPGEEEGDPDTYSGEITAESGKIYVDKASNLSYRWSGSAFIGISSPLALGETASTAYAGDKGKAVTDNFNTHAANNDIHVTAADKTAWNSKSNFSGSYNDLTDKPTIETEVEIGSTSPVGDVKLFVDTNADYNIEVYSKTQANNKFSKVIDLNSAPTSSTISYTEDNNTVYFKTGDEVRVPDQDADSGYTFYKLYKLETVSDVTTATWDELGSGSVDLYEHLTIHLTTNQSSHSDIIGATVVVVDTEGSETLLNTTWDGTDIELDISPSVPYTVTVGNVTDYSTPAAVSYISKVGNSRTAEFTYNTEVVTVTCTSSDSEPVTGKKITIAGTEYTLTATGVVTAKVPFGSNYSIVGGAWSGYAAPSASYTAENATRSVSMQWTEIVLGVFIEATDKALYTSSTWPYTGKTANGVVVITSNCMVRVALSEILISLHKNNEDPLNNYLTPINVEASAKADYDGASNTTKIIQFNTAYGTNTTSYAAPYCAAYTFPDGVTKGYLAACGQMWAIYQNKTEIKACLAACGGEDMFTLNYWYRTSTNFGAYGTNSARTWGVRGSDGLVSPWNSMTAAEQVRPVSTFTF